MRIPEIFNLSSETDPQWRADTYLESYGWALLDLGSLPFLRSHVYNDQIALNLENDVGALHYNEKVLLTAAKDLILRHI